MREILFRGKRFDNGEWLYGYFGIDDNKPLIAINKENGINGYFVYPETIGQYTGLRDKNGTRIFEGDIVNCNYFCGVVYFYEGAWCVSEKDKYPEDLYDLISLEVIGNIHGNPELLEGEDNG